MDASVFPRSASGDDELFLMDDFLLKDDAGFHSSNSGVSQTHSHSLAGGMETFDHVDALLLGFDLDAPLDAAMVSSSSAPLEYRQEGMNDTHRSNDGSASPTTTDDMSGSEASSPAPSFTTEDHLHLKNASPSSSPVRAPPLSQRITSNTRTESKYNPVTPAAATTFQRGVLPYALPVAYFPPQPVVTLNMNQKRPFQPEVLPNAMPPAAITASTSASGDVTLTKKSKREIRQMKNRESANKSRLRRKAQMSELSEEVQELTKKQHELQNTIAALRAENKSLHDQNSFLRSLVAKPSTNNEFLLQQQQVQQQQLSDESMFADETNFSSLSALESGQQLEIAPPQKKSKTSRVTTFSAASLSLCASVFGITILSDSEHGASDAGNIRRPGRILHSLPASIDSGFSPAPSTSLLDVIWDGVMSSWTFLSSSELAFGVLLNVLSFVVIMGLYHMWQSSSFTTETTKEQHMIQKSMTRSSGKHHCVRNNETKRRSVSWQDIRLRDANGEHEEGANSRTANSVHGTAQSSRLPRVRDLL
ncbi:Atp-dependent RNA helicase, partial [Globisporangium splendens]